MRYSVTQPFQSLTRKFEPGMEIDESEIDGPVPAERWVEMGRIEPLPDEPEDFAAEQARLKAAWDAIRGSGVPEPVWLHGLPILIADEALYGGIVSDDDAATVDVQVFGEDHPRRYPRAALDLDARAVRGEYQADEPAPAPLPLARYTDAETRSFPRTIESAPEPVSDGA